eukprot:Sspe_Gene.75800::Locus_47362_Transcript_1_1_Confidence_1.000_Length_603::g.75800::m.75800
MGCLLPALLYILLLSPLVVPVLSRGADELWVRIVELRTALLYTGPDTWIVAIEGVYSVAPFPVRLLGALPLMWNGTGYLLADIIEYFTTHLPSRRSFLRRKVLADFTIFTTSLSFVLSGPMRPYSTSWVRAIHVP